MTDERPLGEPVPDWQAPPRPDVTVLEGRHARLERLAPRHTGALFAAFSADREGALWTYMPHGPFRDEASLGAWVTAASTTQDPSFFAITDLASQRTCGVASYLRIQPEAGSIEVGWITYGPELQRTRTATEAMFLMMRWAFEAGYRRYEWKCNALNLASRSAAQRLGFSFEGVFRQATVVKGRNRDTAWFAVIDREWPALRQAYEAWLAPGNFDENGRQRQALGTLTAEALASG